MSHRARAAGLVWLLFAVGACGGSEPGVCDYPPSLPAVIPLDGQILYPVVVDDRPGQYSMVVDTGAWSTTVDERLVRDLNGGQGVVTLDFGNGVVLEDRRVFAADLSVAESYIGVPIYGLIGQDLFNQLYFGLDYRASEVIAATPIPEQPQPVCDGLTGVEVAYSLERELPMAEVQVGGQMARLVADTGSGVTVLTESYVPAALLAQGITGYWWHTSYGSDPGTLVRLPSLRVGGYEVTDSWVVVVPDDFHLRALLESIGVTVHGFLGFPVYRRFYVGVHGPESRFVFYPYPDLDHIDGNEWDRVGFEIRRDDGDVVVDMVFDPSDASAMGVEVDDVLDTVDGERAADLPLDEVRLLLRGTPGETRVLELERGGSPVTLQVAVDRLLPPLEM